MSTWQAWGPARWRPAWGASKGTRGAAVAAKAAKKGGPSQAAATAAHV
jgi:hypothetical protein